MKRFCLFLCLIIFLSRGKAEDLILKSGRILKNYRIYNVESSGLAISHEYGAATIPFADLPDSLRAKYSEQEKQFELEKKAKTEARQQQNQKAEIQRKKSEKKNSFQAQRQQPKAETQYTQKKMTPAESSESENLIPKHDGNALNNEKKAPAQSNTATEYHGTRTIYIGPRGGRYYINRNGKKTYIRRKK